MLCDNFLFTNKNYLQQWFFMRKCIRILFDNLWPFCVFYLLRRDHNFPLLIRNEFCLGEPVLDTGSPVICVAMVHLCYTGYHYNGRSRLPVLLLGWGRFP